MFNFLYERGSNSSLILGIGCCSSSWSSPVPRNVQVRKHAKFVDSSYMVPIEENPFDLEFSRTLSEKSSTTPLRGSLGKETSKEMKLRGSAPGLVARLMGLDALPPEATRQKGRGINCQNISSVGFHGKHKANEGCPILISCNEYQECKDVFEVMEMPKVDKRKNKLCQNGISNFEQNKIDLKASDVDLAFARHKSMNPAQLSSDDEFVYREQYNNALEDLDPYESLFTKYLQEPSSLFRKHLQDLRHSPPSPHASHITILKPSKATTPDSELRSRSERNAVRHSHLLKTDKSPCRKYVPNIVNQPIKERNCSITHMLSESLYAGETKGCDHHSAQIVVLKPSLDKALETVKTVSLVRSLANYPYNLRVQKGTSMRRKSEIYGGEKERHKIFNSVKVYKHKIMEAREIARDITEKLRSPGSSGSKMSPDSRKYWYIRDESRDDISSLESLKSESHRQIFDQLNDRSDSSSSSHYSTESLVSKEARKRLSERLNLMRQFQEVEPVNKGSNTLGDMLVSDRQRAKSTAVSPITHDSSVDKVARDEILVRWDSPIINYSKDDCKDLLSRNLSSSKVILPSSSIHENQKPSRRNRSSISSSSDQNVLSENPVDLFDRNGSQKGSSVPSLKYSHLESHLSSSREECNISWSAGCVSSEQLHDKMQLRRLGVEVCLVRDLCSNSMNSGRGHDGSDFAPQHEDTKFQVIGDDYQVQQSAVLEDDANHGELSGANANHVSTKEASVDPPQVISISSNCDISESHSPVSSKEDQPSPVSVLEPPPSEEKSSSKCFEKISADLKELRMQLKLLKLESADSDAEDFELLVSSDEDVGAECHSPESSVEMLEAFRDDEDRDFSYLLDVLIHSGVHSASVNGLYNACYTEKYSPGQEVFEKLEKKYNVLVSWSKSDRKLLFDLISSILAEIITPSVNVQSLRSRFQPILAREVLVEEVWQLVVKQRKDLSDGNLNDKFLLEPRWVDIRDDVDMLGKEIENRLTDELMEDLLFELV